MLHLEIAQRELRCFLNDRLTNRAVNSHEVEMLAKLREALALIDEARLGLHDSRPDRLVCLRAVIQH
jgi:hypothetical protein